MHGGWGETATATAPFPKSRASYFCFARFNMSALYYPRAWNRLIQSTKVNSTYKLASCSGRILV